MLALIYDAGLCTEVHGPAYLLTSRGSAIKGNGIQPLETLPPQQILLEIGALAGQTPIFVGIRYALPSADCATI